MKRIILPILFVIFCSASNAQWILTNGISVNWSLNSVWFTDANTGYAAGYSGILIKTIDGGTTWDTLSSGTTSDLNCVRFINANIGFADGNNSTLLMTTDAGKTWKKISDGISSNVSPYNYDIDFTNTSIGYIAGGNLQTIIKTTDGGNTWTPYSIMNTYSIMNSVNFPTMQTGYAGGNGVIVKTTDGGMTWDTLTTILQTWVKSINFTDSLNGYATCGSSILKTTNGGLKWTVLNTGLKNKIDLSFHSCLFTSPNQGYVVGTSSLTGAGIILRTSNAGATWDSLPLPQLPTYTPFSSIFFTDANTGYVVGDRVILKTTDGGGPVTSVIDLNQNVNSNLYPNPVTNFLNLKSINQSATISIYDIQGKLTFSQQNINNQINVGNLQNGVYFIKINDNNKITTEKFIKR